jgi:hypothetical protein
MGAVLIWSATAPGQSIVGNVSTTFGAPIPGVLVTATNASQQFSDTTDGRGDYSIATGFHPIPTAYHVVPSKPGYTFTPPSTNVTFTLLSGNSTNNFTTPATVPSATTQPATALTATSATLNGTVNPDGAATTAWFEYGLTTGYGSVSSSTSIGSGILAVPVNIGASGLLNGTNYHYRLAASNHFGVSRGSDSSFSTPSGIPLITTLPPSSSGARAITLHGLVGLQGASASAWFEWGLTSNYGNITPSQSVTIVTEPTEVSQVVTGLVTASTYHYRAVGASSVGTAYGTDGMFTPIFNDAAAGLPGVYFGSVATGDFDNDGYPDLLLTGTTNSSAAKPVTQVWRNTGSGFTNVARLPGVYLSSVALGDYDNDGRLDILLTGSTNGSATGAVAQVWRNTGSGFTNINADLPGVYQSSVAWGDYDNDGRLDILLTGTTNGSASGALAQVWGNTGTGFTNINAGLPGVYQSSVAWGDYDNDGRLDILLTGQDATGTPIAQVWRNTGSGFTNINAGLTGVYESSAAWGDFDNDGRLDIVLSGYSTTGPVTQVWRNTTNGFTNINAGLPGVYEGSAAWGDFDKDGRLDILLTGSGLAQVWRNTGSGFVEVDSGLPELEGSSAAWLDYDNDGYPDILLTGGSRNPVAPPPPPPPTPLTQVWRNNFVVLRLALSGPALTNGQFHLFLNGLAGASYITQASPDLAAWTPMSTNTLSTNRVGIIDANAGTYPKRFYRAVQSAP